MRFVFFPLLFLLEETYLIQRRDYVSSESRSERKEGGRRIEAYLSLKEENKTERNLKEKKRKKKNKLIKILPPPKKKE